MMIKKLVLPFILLAVLAACSDEPAGLPDFTGLVDESAPAIVNISGSSTQQEKPQRQWFEWFRDFDGEPEKSPHNKRPHTSLGSGFILSRDGEILTNNHVVDGAQEILVTLADHRQFKAQVLGRDVASDLALLKIEAGALPTLQWGDSDALKVGEWVLAIGSPFGFEHTVTAGIVSGKRRALASEQYVPFLQTDVAINPGNSGGPLFSLDGKVVGVNSQIFSRTGGYMGLSFAIPSATAQRVVKQLRQHGSVKRAWLGVVIQKVDAALAQSFGLKRAHGALVSQVDPDGPAQAAGIQAGDVILSLDDEPVLNSTSLPPMVGQHAPGDRVRLQLMRDGKRVNLRLQLSELPSAGPDSSDWVGLRLKILSPKQAARLNLDNGLLVDEIQRGSAAELAGLKPGDIIVSALGQPVSTPQDLRQLLAQIPRGASAALLVARGQRSLFLALTRPDGSE